MTASRPLSDWTDDWQDWAPPARPAATARARPAAPAPGTRSRARPAPAPATRSRARPAPGSRARTTRTPQAQRRPAGERARRARHLRALRRDLLLDFIAAFLLMLTVLVVTAGLGVVALLEIPVLAAVLASFVFERRRRSRAR